MAHQLCAHLDAFTSVSQQEAGQFSVPHAEINSSNSLSLWGTACWRLNQEHQVKPVQIYKTTCYLKLSLFTFQEPWSPSFHGNGFKIIMGFAQKKKQPAETGRDWTYRYYVGEDFYSPKWSTYLQGVDSFVNSQWLNCYSTRFFYAHLTVFGQTLIDCWNIN